MELKGRSYDSDGRAVASACDTRSQRACREARSRAPTHKCLTMNARRARQASNQRTLAKGRTHEHDHVGKARRHTHARMGPGDHSHTRQKRRG
eukprot:6010513-Pleurochrysis_carterae.AAC.1